MSSANKYSKDIIFKVINLINFNKCSLGTYQQISLLISLVEYKSIIADVLDNFDKLN